MSSGLPSDLSDRLKRVRVIALDVDGVLTDGRLVYFPDGAMSPSGFHVHDGVAIRAALECGLKVIFVSGNSSAAVLARATHLGVSAHWLGVADKVGALKEASSRFDVPLDQFAYFGDDLNDLAPMRVAGLAVAVRQAALEVRAAAHVVTERQGGFGAVREGVERILRAQGLWDRTVALFVESEGRESLRQ